MANYSNPNIFVIPYSTTKKGITTLFHLENFQCSFSTIPLQPLTIQMGKTDGRADGRTGGRADGRTDGRTGIMNSA